MAGHWEVDQIIGANNRSSMIWLTERQSRYLIPITMPDGYAAEAVFAGLLEGLDTHPRAPAPLADLRLRRPNGRTGAASPATTTCRSGFCDPHSPWQRGQIENLNRQVRWWFPRGTDLRLVTVAQAEHAADILNNQRRRSLNHTSPAELYAALTAH